jgi:hypothetical protein
MDDVRHVRAIDDYWGRKGLEQAILEALIASGKSLDTLTIDDLAPLDQFHGGGKGATVRLARLAGLRPGMRVLDVGGGLGGPAAATATRAASSWYKRCSTDRKRRCSRSQADAHAPTRQSPYGAYLCAARHRLYR